MKPFQEEMRDLFDDLNDGFGKFKEHSAGELNDIRDAIRTLETGAARIPAGGSADRFGTGSRSEAVKAFDAFLRTGDTAAMRPFIDPQAAQTTLSSPDGGFAVPQEISKQVEKLELQYSPMRKWANVEKVSTDRPERLVNIRGVNAGWVGETQARPVTQTDKLELVVIPTGEIYAQPSATQRVVDDIMYNLEAYISESVAQVFSATEGAAFAAGDGLNKPKGILTAPTSLLPDKTRPFGQLQYIKTGVAGAFAAASPGDVLVDLVHSLRAPYRQGPNTARQGVPLGERRC